MPGKTTIIASALPLALAFIACTVMAQRPSVVAPDQRVQPELVFPTACPILQSLEFGTADLTLTVEPDASVGKVIIDKSSGHPMLDEAFRKALAKSSVVSGRVDGKPQTMPIAVNMKTTPGSRSPYGYSIWVTVTGGSQPRVAAYNCQPPFP